MLEKGVGGTDLHDICVFFFTKIVLDGESAVLMCEFSCHFTLHLDRVERLGFNSPIEKLFCTLNLRCSHILMYFGLYWPHLHQQLRKHVPCFNSTLAKNSHITRIKQSMYCHIRIPSRTCHCIRHMINHVTFLAWNPCQLGHFKPTKSAKEASQCMGQEPINTPFSFNFFLKH